MYVVPKALIMEGGCPIRQMNNQLNFYTIFEVKMWSIPGHHLRDTQKMF